MKESLLATTIPYIPIGAERPLLAVSTAITIGSAVALNRAIKSAQTNEFEANLLPDPDMRAIQEQNSRSLLRTRQLFLGIGAVGLSSFFIANAGLYHESSESRASNIDVIIDTNEQNISALFGDNPRVESTFNAVLDLDDRLPKSNIRIMLAGKTTTEIELSDNTSNETKIQRAKKAISDNILTDSGNIAGSIIEGDADAVIVFTNNFSNKNQQLVDIATKLGKEKLKVISVGESGESYTTAIGEELTTTEDLSALGGNITQEPIRVTDPNDLDDAINEAIVIPNTENRKVKWTFVNYAAPFALAVLSAKSIRDSVIGLRLLRRN